jgi:Predicted transcriptional regulator
MMSIGTILEQKRKERGLLQAELAALLADEGILVSKHAVSKWESDKTLPNAQQFLALCRELKIYDVLGEFLGEADELRTGLNELGKKRLREYARLLRGSEAFRAIEQAPLRVLPLYDLAVSAGTGQFLDGENYEMMECGVEVPEGAHFGVRIAGNSMEPRYHDGQTIWVRQQRSLMSGEIGIFLYDGDAYLKKLVAEDGQVKLHSLNPAYEDIVVSSALPLRVLGKVLS